MTLEQDVKGLDISRGNGQTLKGGQLLVVRFNRKMKRCKPTIFSSYIKESRDLFYLSFSPENSKSSYKHDRMKSNGDKSELS